MVKVKAIKSAADVERILASARAWNPKYRMFLELGFCTGLRVSDILSLRVSSFGRERIKIKEKKSGKIRIIELDKELRASVKSYIEKFELTKSDYLIFRSASKKEFPLSRVRAWQVIKKLSDFLSIPNVGTHSLRKTFAHCLYDETRDIAVVQQALNHGKVETTVKHYLD